jgi:hypothetical protein
MKYPFWNFETDTTRVSDQIASFDIDSQSTSKAVLLHPFIPIVCSADENEVVRCGMSYSFANAKFRSLLDTSVNYCE